MPTIYGRPTLVAVTTPRDVAPDRVLRGWWRTVRTWPPPGLSRPDPPGNRGIGYLERLDQAPWPPGRYEFTSSPAKLVSMTVCLTRRG
jgi:hypothetical protein